MSESLLRLCLQASGTALVLLPPALMLVRWVRPRLMPVWLLVCLLIFGGWALANPRRGLGSVPAHPPHTRP